MRDRSARVVIVGGGVIGASIAYQLAKRGDDVVVLERDELTAGATGANDGGIVLQTKRPGVHLELAYESSKLFPKLSQELERDFEYEQQSAMLLIRTEDELAAIQQHVAHLQEHGLPVRIIDGDETRRLEPALAADVAGATYLDATYGVTDGRANPYLLTFALADAATRLGARFCTGETVTGIEVSGRPGEWENQRFAGVRTGPTAAGSRSDAVEPPVPVGGVRVAATGMAGGQHGDRLEASGERRWVQAVVTDRGRIPCEVVVNAAGAWAPAIGQMVGLDIPIKPRRGQIMVLERCPPLLRHFMLAATYTALKFNPSIVDHTDDPLLKIGGVLALDQTPAGTILLGGTREFVGYDTRTTFVACRAIAQAAARWAPPLARLRVIRTFAGLRPYTPDGLPILGAVDEIEGYYIAAGHEGDGIALSAITGVLIAEHLTTGRTSLPLEPFRLSRFATAAS